MPNDFEDFELRIASSSDQRRPETFAASAPDARSAAPWEDERPLTASAGFSKGSARQKRRPSAGKERTFIAHPEPLKKARWKPTYSVLARSSQGARHGVFKFPFSDDEARRLVQQGPLLDDKTLEDFGVRLYRAAFVEEIGTLFRLTDLQARRANRGLRLRMVLEAAELTELPWEIVRPPDWGYAPALSERTRLVRHVDLLAEHRSLDVQGTAQVQLVTAQPRDQQPQALEKE
jgi:hypothetical protein